MMFWLFVCCLSCVCVFFSLPGEWSGGLIISTAVGWSVSVGLGLLCCIYVATLHENDLWFSNIKVRVLHSSFHHRLMWLMKQQPSVMCRRSILSNSRERVELPKTTWLCQQSYTATFCSEEFAFCFANLWSLICCVCFNTYGELWLSWAAHSWDMIHLKCWQEAALFEWVDLQL